MSTPYYSTPERIAALVASAQSWDGTPFSPAAGVRGAGACCHRLAAGVIGDSGFPLTQAEIPDGTMNRATHHPGSIIGDWLRTHQERFLEVDATEAITAGLQPGDILLVRFGVGSNHVAVALPGDCIIQTWQGVGAHICRLPANIRSRISYVFRPLSQ